MTHRRISQVVLTLFACAAALAATAEGLEREKTVYQPMGAPADPKVAVRWNMYHDYAQATDLLRAMAKAHPERARLRSLGKSYGGREMWVLTVTNFATGDDRDKPAFWAQGAIHANEIQATEAVLYSAWYLLEMYGRNEHLTRLVDERTFYFLPMMSPDSRDDHMYEPNSTSSPRSGQRPFDDDNDGLVDEDPADDLDGDGHITQMRILDPNGRHKPHPDYPHLMIEAEPDQPGEYRLLGTEGLDNDGDGRVNEDGDGYYDPNRDWPWNWQPNYVQRGAGKYPLSIGENRLAAEFVLDHPNIAAAQSFHNAGGMLLRGPGTEADNYDAADVAVYDTIGRRGETILPGYRYLVTYKDLYSVYGGEKDFFHQMRGVFVFVNEMFTSTEYFGQSGDGGYSGKPLELEKFNRYLLFDEGMVPWHEVEHPQYGKVEVGGWKKQWTRQPPSFLLEESLHRNMAFILYHADQMPRVEVQSATVRPAPGGLIEVTAVVANTRLAPTHSAVDVKRHITPPDRVKIEGRGVKVIAGLWSRDRLLTAATDQKHQPGELRIPNIPGMSAVYVRWLVQGKGPYTITVRSEKGGTASFTALRKATL